jgi:hypothetical protein
MVKTIINHGDPVRVVKDSRGHFKPDPVFLCIALYLVGIPFKFNPTLSYVMYDKTSYKSLTFRT